MKQNSRIGIRGRLYIAVMGLAVICSCSSNNKEANENSTTTKLKEESLEVGYEVIHPKNFYVELVSNGKLQARRRADIRFEANEPVISISVRNGDRVKKRQIIAEADKKKMLLTLQKVSDSKNRAFLEMQDVLIGQGYKVSEMVSVPANIMKLAETRSGYAQACLEYKSAQMMLEAATLKAPFAGIIANLNSKPYNMPSGEAFCTVIDDGIFDVEFTVLENELITIKKGQTVVVEPYATDNVTISGSVNEINPIINENGLVRVKATVNNKKGILYEGMSVKVKLRRSVGIHLAVNKKAVVMRDGKQVVFTLRGNRANWNYVQTGLENSDSYTITGGLLDGDSVITSGNLHLAHQTSIVVKK
ncbi:MAG: efflux RND transporter periplasmic adaptor subunit [Bacteroidaceae bacterium]